MKKILMFAVFVSAFSAVPVLAQEAPEASSDSKPPRAARMFEKMDLDGDGMVTKEEFTKAHEDRFAKMDADGDGKITDGELAAFKRSMHEKYHGMKRRAPKSEGAESEAPATADVPAESAE